MNYLQLCQKANTASGFQGVLSTASAATGYQATLCQFVTQAYVDLQNLRKDWPWMRSSVSFDTVVDQTAYTLFEIFGMGVTQDIARWIGVIYTDSDSHVHQLREYSYDRYLLEEVVNAGSSLPDIYMIDPVDKSLSINPPNAIYSMTAYYYTQPVTLTNNTDTPLLPVSFHWFIVYQAAAHMAGFVGNSNLFQINQAKADAQLGMLMRSENPAKKVRVVGIA